jgi:uncharacterized membrane protein
MESPFLQAHGMLKYIGLFLSGICHQLPEHSIFLGGHQIPLCARCSGTYLGTLLVLVNLWYKRRMRASRLPPVRLLGAAVLAAILWAGDGINSYYQFLTGRVGLYPPSNILRVLTGMGMGLSLSLVIFPMFNLTAWRNPDEQRVINSAGELGVLILQAVGIAAVLQIHPSILYWPLLVADTLGVLLVLTVVNSMIVTILLQQTNRAVRWRQLVLPLALGLALTLAEVVGIAWLRWWLVVALSMPAL